VTVTDSWQTITRWLGDRLPAAIADLNPPASATDIRDLESAIGLELPADLREWLQLNDGMGAGGSFGRILPPLHNPIPCRRILTEHATWMSICGAPSNDPAGSLAWDYAPAFVPFADDGAGTSLFVDLRGGDRHGCVGHWDPEMGAYDRPLWPSVAAMLADIATALGTGTTALESDGDGPDRWQVELKDGKWLSWNQLADPEFRS
jgi:cell wall assembly regulator SMI1